MSEHDRGDLCGFETYAELFDWLTSDWPWWRRAWVRFKIRRFWGA